MSIERLLTSSIATWISNSLASLWLMARLQFSMHLPNAYVSLEVDCKKIGSIEGIDSCTGVQVSQASASSNAGAIVGIIIGIMAVLGLVTYLVLRKRKRMKAEEQAPMFKRAKNGVMNHDSDILGGSSMMHL
jgi:hypothetical protein